MNRTDHPGPRRIDPQSACAAIALVLALGLGWSFVTSTRIVQWPTSQALVADIRAAMVHVATQGEAEANAPLHISYAVMPGDGRPGATR